MNIKYLKLNNTSHIVLFLSHLKCSNSAPINEDALKQALKRQQKEDRRQQRIQSQVANLNKKKHIKENTVQGSLPPYYDPQFIESQCYQKWGEDNFFNPDLMRKSKADHHISFNRNKIVSMILPPPNITGTLHLGHAIGCSIQDAFCRWHRMKGYEVLWVPGSDHAGIATQVVVERQLFTSKGLLRFDLGREKFLNEVDIWKEKNNKRIFDQLKKVGSSLDWSRLCFTLDKVRSHAVTEAFIRLYKGGVIYRDTRLVSWSCALQSTISDIEVDSLKIDGKTQLNIPGYNEKVTFGVLSTFRYPIVDSDEYIKVSTTRLETMLGDTAVAVHPSDSKYSKLIGRFVYNALANKNLPIVADEAVDPAFGTGAVKVTPAHDPTDFLISKRHQLPSINIINDAGKLENVAPEFLGLPRFLARKKIKNALHSLNLFDNETDYSMTLPICSRSGDVVEYRAKPQWFVKCREMADKAIKALETGELIILPEHYVKPWYNWLQNTGDWCISRQLWWGHRVPAYRVIRENSRNNKNTSKDEMSDIWVVGKNENEALIMAAELLKCHMSEIKVIQDDDVLDTWFSSALLPFSCFGWPENTPDLLRYYPLDLMETAGDILFFWVARMVMLGQQLTGQIPFKKVLLHSIIRDGNGKKMSKSLGNVIDPLHVISGFNYEKNTHFANSDKNAAKANGDIDVNMQLTMKKEFPSGIPECGADALRIALLSSNYTSHFINVDMNQFVSARHFCNKLWQAVRYFDSKSQNKTLCFDAKANDSLTHIDKWILSRLSHVISTCNSAFDTLEIYHAAKAIRDFVWQDLCDVYLEYSKFSNDNYVSLSIIKLCLEKCLLLLHPIAPFITEELNHHFKPDDATISFEQYPNPNDFTQFKSAEIESEVRELRAIAYKIRSIKTAIQRDYSTEQLVITNNKIFKQKIFASLITILPTYIYKAKIVQKSVPRENKEHHNTDDLDASLLNNALHFKDDLIIAEKLNNLDSDECSTNNTYNLKCNLMTNKRDNLTAAEENTNNSENLMFTSSTVGLLNKYLSTLQALVRIKSCVFISQVDVADNLLTNIIFGESDHKVVEVPVVSDNDDDLKIYLMVHKKNTS